MKQPTCRLSAAAANVATRAAMEMLDGGWIDLFAGKQPDSPDHRVKGQVHVCRIQLGDPAFATPVNGRTEARKTWESDPAIADGHVEWFRAYRKDGFVVMDGSVGMTGSPADLVINDTSVKTGTKLVMSSAVLAAN
jgi:hypothetical protein